MVRVFQRVWVCGMTTLVSVVGILVCVQNPSPVLGQPAPAVRTASTIPGFVVPDGLGANIHWTNPRPGEMRMLAATGVRWIRMDFAWGATETKKGQYNFASYLRLITALRRYHIRPLLILDYGNPLYQHGVFPTTSVARHAFAKWAVAAVKTFRGDGVMWEMWNEPNGGMGNNNVPVPPAAYAKLAVEVGRAIHRADPHALYVGPTLSGMDRPWLKRILRDGVLKEFDAVTVHPYRQTPPETVGKDYANFRQLIARYSPSSRVIPLISSEWGYSTTWMKRNANRQGKYLAREFLTNLMYRIPLSIWYDWHNDGPSGLDLPNAGSIEFFDFATSTNSRAKKHLELFAKGRPWTFNNGPEFPGATGSFRVGRNHQTPVGILNYDFAGGGNYVDAGVNVAIRKADTLALKVKSPKSQQILIRIVDSSDQTVQWIRPYSNVKHWQTLRINLMHGSNSYWGGQDNGVVDFPITSISIGVQNIYPAQERHFGMVKFTYHPHRHWVYTPKPAFFACRTLTHTLCGFQFEKRVEDGNPNDFVLVFARGSQRRWVAWSMVKSKPGRGVVVLPLPEGTYRVINYLGSEHITAKAGTAGLRLQLSTGPQYVIPWPAGHRERYTNGE